MLKCLTIPRQVGVTLIELMVVIVFAAILLALALPAFQGIIDRNRLKAVTDTLYSDFQFAKSEAIKRNQSIVVDFTTSNAGATWCYGFKLNAASCDCTLTNPTAANACVIDGILKVVNNTDYSRVSITPSADFTFDNVRGTVNSGGASFDSVTLNSVKGKQTRVDVNDLGRIQICSPSGNSNVTGYTACP